MCQQILLKTPLHLHVNVQHWEVKLWKNSLKPLTVDLTICFLLQWSKQVEFLQRKQFGKLFMVMAALPTTNRWEENANNVVKYIHFINIYFRQHNYIIKAMCNREDFAQNVVKACCGCNSATLTSVSVTSASHICAFLPTETDYATYSGQPTASQICETLPPTTEVYPSSLIIFRGIQYTTRTRKTLINSYNKTN